ncbi:MAG: YdcF family protein [Microgenomates group bacterium]
MGSESERVEVKPLKVDFLSWKLGIIEAAYKNPRHRQRIIEQFNKEAVQVPDYADVTIILGTSLSQFPDKFKKRVYLASRLALNKRTGLLIFTGLQDHETDDVNQADDALNLAVKTFGVPSNLCITVGGNNTQENFVAARESILLNPDTKSAFVVSDSRHLLRSMNVGRYELEDFGVKLFPKSTDLKHLDPDDPRVILEIIKLLAYHRSLYHIPSVLSPQQKKAIREQIDSTVKNYSKAILANKEGENVEQPFDEWLAEYNKNQHDIR